MTGERNGNASLTADDVRAIRARWAAGGVDQRTLAQEYGVTTANIHRIVKRISWKYVD